jgi:hypothetical protein
VGYWPGAKVKGDGPPEFRTLCSQISVVMFVLCPAGVLISQYCATGWWFHGYVNGHCVLVGSRGEHLMTHYCLMK